MENTAPTHSQSTVQLAVGVICFKDDKVLLIKRSKAPKAGEWSIPGGRLEPNESLEQAALRELQEETGIDARLGPKVEIIDADFGSHHYLIHDYLAIWESGELQARDDALDAKWVTLKQVKNIPMWEKTHEVILKAHALRA